MSVFIVGANFSCMSGWLRVWGNIQAHSDHQRALIIQALLSSPAPSQADTCFSPITGHYIGKS